MGTCIASSATWAGRRSGKKRRRRWRTKRGGGGDRRWTRWASSASRTSCSRRRERTRRTFWPSTLSWRGKTQAKQSENLETKKHLNILCLVEVEHYSKEIYLSFVKQPSIIL